MERVIKIQYVWQDGEHFIKEVFTLDEIEQGKQFETFTDAPLHKNYRCVAKRRFTGLTDKNGKEIYEGDIVEGYKGGSNQDRYYKGVLEWNQQQCGFIYRCGKYIGEILALAMDGDNDEIRLSKFEIIGNIYENPELLNQL